MIDDPNNPRHYHITLKEPLDAHWQAWFDDLRIERTANGTTVLSGPIVDQAALHGIFKKINNLGLTLISVIPHRKGAK